MNTVKDWSTIWIGCCTIVNSALLTLRLNHSRQIQRSASFPKKVADGSSSRIESRPPKVPLTYGYFIGARYFTFSVVTNAFVPLDRNKYPFSARPYIEHVSRNYRKFIYWMIYFISKFLPDVRQRGVQHVVLCNGIQENVISQLSVCIN